METTIDYKALIDKYQDMRYFTTDPIAVVKQCIDVLDIEVMGIVCSWLALGNRNQIYKHCVATYEMMCGTPYNYLISREWKKEKDNNSCYYRMFRHADFYDLMNSLYTIYENYPTLEDAILHYIGQNPTADYLDALISLITAHGIPQNKTSACKRLCLFLRWMVRQNSPVDLGIWTRLDAHRLLIPLDVHVGRIAREQGLLTRTASDMKAVTLLTDHCQQLFPNDPCAMDFALFGLGYTHAQKK